MTIKKFTALALAASAIAFGGAAFAQSSGTASMQLASDVPLNCFIGVKPTAKATALDLQKGEENTHLADVIETCNSASGYVVVMRSDNQGQLLPKFEGGTPTSYDLKYDDGADGSIKEKMVAFREKPAFDVGRKLFVNIGANPATVAGHYTDNLTLEIAAK